MIPVLVDHADYFIYLFVAICICISIDLWSRNSARSEGISLRGFRKDEKEGLRGLYILFGGSFRFRGNGDGNPESFGDGPEIYYGQQNASRSHVQLYKVMEKLGYRMDLIIVTYSTQYDKDLLSFYNHSNIRIVDYRFYAERRGRASGLLDWPIGPGRPIAKNIENYEFIFFSRIDVLYKDLFIRKFLISSRIWYAFVAQIGGHTCTTPVDGVETTGPAVGDMQLYVPRRYFPYLNLVILEHWGVCVLMNAGLKVGRDVTFFVDTYHETNTRKDWNPLYRVVNRVEYEEWRAPGIVYVNATNWRPSNVSKTSDFDEHVLRF